jgi:uncharacterized coiled-coil protein SlyX
LIRTLNQTIAQQAIQLAHAQAGMEQLAAQIAELTAPDSDEESE